MFKQLPEISLAPASRDIETHLERAQQKLDAAATILVGAGLLSVAGDSGPDLNVCQVLLQETAALLAEVPQTYETKPAVALIELMRGVQARTLRIQMLLDAAAAFYRGWLCAVQVPSADYTPPGVWGRASTPGRLVLEA
jgi:hypothetical protein